MNSSVLKIILTIDFTQLVSVLHQELFSLLFDEVLLLLVGHSVICSNQIHTFYLFTEVMGICGGRMFLLDS